MLLPGRQLYIDDEIVFTHVAVWSSTLRSLEQHKQKLTNARKGMLDQWTWHDSMWPRDLLNRATTLTLRCDDAARKPHLSPCSWPNALTWRWQKELEGFASLPRWRSLGSPESKGRTIDKVFSFGMTQKGSDEQSERVWRMKNIRWKRCMFSASHSRPPGVCT